MPCLRDPALPDPASALRGPVDILGQSYADLTQAFSDRFGKGEYHAGALFRSLYRKNQSVPSTLPEFADNPALAEKVAETFGFRLPEIVPTPGGPLRMGESAGSQTDGSAPGGDPTLRGPATSRGAAAYKFLLKLRDGLESESVIIPMRKYKSLCVSSQVGCRMGCNFCETAQMGYVRSLDAGEIVAQVMVARFVLGEPVENVVFMGMGEPMDNLDQVLQAVRILSDQRGLDIPQSSITVSTVGHVDGIRRLAALAAKSAAAESTAARGSHAGNPRSGFSRLHLAVSLNAPNDAIRSRIMPVNAKWPLSVLKEALRDYPLANKDDFLFMEYVLIPGVNDAREHALEVAEYLRGLRTCLNLIPYNPRHESPYARPSADSVKNFYRWATEAGQYCRIRGTKGDDSMAACGQLGNRALSRRRPGSGKTAP